MKQTKTRRFLLVVTLMLLVLTLGLGLFFMQPKSASAEEVAELVPLADAELQQTQAIKAGTGGGVWWDGLDHTQMRLMYYKVQGGDNVKPTRLTEGGQKKYSNTDKIKIVQGGDGQYKTLTERAVNTVVWLDNMGAVNGDENVGELWISFTDPVWIEGISEVMICSGFEELNGQGTPTGVKTTKDYYFWNAGYKGWQTRIDASKGIEVTYTGDGVDFGEKLNPSEFTVKATLKGSEEATEIDASACTYEYNYNGLTEGGQMTVTVKYQDAAAKTVNVTVAATDATEGLEILHDGNHACDKAHRTDWDATQMSFFVSTKGESAPKPDTATNTTAWLNETSNVTDFLLFNGENYDTWRWHVAWISYFANQTSSGEENVYEIWFCIKQGDAHDQAHKDWKNGIQTVTFKAGFRIDNTNDPNKKLVVKEDVTLWNAHDAGWQRAVSEITAKTAGDVSLSCDLGQQLSAEELAKLTVTGKFIDGSEDKTIDNSKVSIALPETAGEGQATITYQGKTAKVNVNMKAKTLDRIEVSNTDGITAAQWTRADFSKIVVKAHFVDEEGEGVTLTPDQYTVTCDTWTKTGTVKATVSYTYVEGQTKTAEFDVSVTAEAAPEAYLEILEEAHNTNAVFPGHYSYALSYKVNFVGVDLKGFNLAAANYYFDKVKGIHLTDYIEFAYGNETKSATELFASGDLEHIGFSDSGRLVICFKDDTIRSKVTQTTFKAGMEIASNQNAFDFGAPQTTLDSTAIFLANAVLKKDYVFYNGGASGWLKAVDTLTASYEGTVLQNNNLNKDNLTVMAKHFGEAQATKLANDAYTVDFSSAEVGDAVQGTVTYRGKTATFTVKVEAPTKTLDRIEVSGTTKFSAARFGTAPALTGLVVTAYFEGEDEGEVLQAGVNGYTVGAMDMWAAEGDHKITVSYTYGTTTKTAEITLAITAPDATKYFEVLEGGSNNGYMHNNTWGNQGEGKNGVRFEWTYAGAERTCLSFKINIVGFTDIIKPETNGINFERVTGIHLGEYIKFTYDGQVKTLAQLLQGEVVKSVGISDGGNLIIWFLDTDCYKKVKDVTFLTGLQLPKITGPGTAWETGATEEQVNQNIELVPGLVLQHDVCLWNADAAGWQLHADSIEATVKAGSKFTAGTADIKSLLEVKAVYGSEKKAITNFTITNYNKDTVGKQNITITYQDRTATLEITVEAAPVTKYDVTFALGDHAASDATAPLKQTADEDAQITLPAAPKAANGYEFDGWYDGTTKAGDANAKYTVTKTVTLTAHWKQVAQPAQKVTVTFNLNGATGTAPASQTIDKGAKATKPATDPVREGYTFGGWYTDANCTTEFDFNGAVNADTTVYAKWTKNTTPDTPVDPDKPADPDKPDDKGEADNGCGSVIGGVGVVLAVMVTLGTALAVIFVKRKKND